jgi:hypothetical protein
MRYSDADAIRGPATRSCFRPCSVTGAGSVLPWSHVGGCCGASGVMRVMSAPAVTQAELDDAVAGGWVWSWGRLVRDLASYWVRRLVWPAVRWASKEWRPI